MDRLPDTVLSGKLKPDGERHVLTCLLCGTATVVASPASPKEGTG